jgi:pimeloyl-ACP methyl ester carboxylesterase
VVNGRRPAPRGVLVDIGGRRLHLVGAGPTAGGPVVLLEAGSFGFSADWAVVQAQLAALGLRSLAYDRAGLGLSDPGPSPRDGLAVAADLERLLIEAAEPGPFVLVGHSMAGLHVQLFAGRNRGRVAGVVLVDAITAEVAADPFARRAAGGYVAFSRLAAGVAALGLLRLMERFGDRIGLDGAAAAHKRWAFSDTVHNRIAAAEVAQWNAVVAQAGAAGAWEPGWPVASVTAGPNGLWRQRELQHAVARGARYGYEAHVGEATHASLLGMRHAERVVEAILHVHRAARAGG